MTQTALFESDNTGTGAIFSPCGRYRYLLWRKWGTGNRIICFGALNPSIASAEVLDPTCTRFKLRAEAGGYDGFQVVNAFAAVSTDPKALLRMMDPVGPLNDGYIVDAARKAETFVACWGSASPLISARSAAIVAMLEAAGVKLWRVSLNQDGQPGHLLYQKLSMEPVRWRARV
jgi:hypothetical protein